MQAQRRSAYCLRWQYLICRLHEFVSKKRTRVCTCRWWQMNTASSRPTFCNRVGRGNGRSQAPKFLSQPVLCCSSGTRIPKGLECPLVLRHCKSQSPCSIQSRKYCKVPQSASKCCMPSNLKTELYSIKTWATPNQWTGWAVSQSYSLRS